MKTIFSLAVLAVLLVAPRPCFALWDIEIVSEERAEELRMEVRSVPVGLDHVGVEVEFEIVGELKDFSRADLRFGQGDNQPVTAHLREDRSKPGRVVVSFTVDRAQLEKLSLWVRVPGLRGGIIYDLRVKDFIEPKNDLAIEVQSLVAGESSGSSVTTLPADARSLVQQSAQHHTAIQQEAEQKIQAERESLIEKLKELQDRYTRDAKLDEAVVIRDRIRQLQAYSATQSAGVWPDPGTLSAYGNRIGETFLFRITGSTAGRVWGTDQYTTDSQLAIAAVHAGVLEPGQSGIVRVTILPGQSSYKGTTRHSVTSDSWGSWPASYRVEPEGGDSGSSSPAITAARPDPGSLRAYRDKVGQTFDFEVVGATQGTIWGTDVYTDDSSLATAAVHAGIIAPHQNATVRVTILPGRSNYSGSTRHGVTSHSYLNWEGSYSVTPAGPQSTRPSLRNY